MANTDDFKNVLEIVVDILKQIGTEIDENKYDGLIIKELTETDFFKENRLNTDGSGQTHIAILKKQWDMFPYIKSEGYFNQDFSDGSLKKYFFIRVPLSLAASNIFYLESEGQEIMPQDNEDKLIPSCTSIYCVQKDGKVNRMQMGLIKRDGPDFLSFRYLLFEKDEPYLFILKIKERFEYEVFAVFSNDISTDYNLSDYTDDFFKLNTETPIDPTKIESLKCHNYLDFAEREGVGENILLYGVPGSGKSYEIENEYCDEETITERILFHPDYTYSDFVGQILPTVSEENQIKYKFTPGPFTSILEKAYKNPKQKYILIIEEINRGNAPAIFGDIFQLLDRKTEFKEKEKDDGYPLGTSEYGIINSDIADIVYEDKEHEVRIPSNLSIIASMNTSDQNVFTLDTAFQRRWDMRLIENDWEKDELGVEILDTGVKWNEFCKKINHLILEENKSGLSSEDKRLGAYFVKEKDFNFDNENLSEDDKKEMSRAFAEKVLKYLWDDAFKFNRDKIFVKEKNEDFSLEYFVKEFKNSKKLDKFKIFKFYNEFNEQNEKTNDSSDNNNSNEEDEESED